MILKDLAAKLSITPVVVSNDEKDVSGVYIGDLLSWVMGRAQSGDAWITIMSNVNVIAVASLSDVAFVLLAEGVTLSDDLLATAKGKDINIYSSPKTSYELAVEISNVLK